VWECSHVGGCRFAANVVVLPYGLYYGGTSPADAEALVEATDNGHLVPELLRGRSSLPAEVQAAEHFVRDRLGGAATRIDALRTVGTRRHDDGCVRVDLVPTDGGTVLQVTVRRHDAGPPALLTCAATRTAAPQEWQLVALDPGTPAEGAGPARPGA
jgi:hypothetical protein